MLDLITPDSFPEEYARPPVYGRPPKASLVRVIERVQRGETQVHAMQE